MLSNDRRALGFVVPSCGSAIKDTSVGAGVCGQAIGGQGGGLKWLETRRGSKPPARVGWTGGGVSCGAGGGGGG